MDEVMSSHELAVDLGSPDVLVNRRTPGGWVESDFYTPPNDEEAPQSPTSEVFSISLTRGSSSRSSSPNPAVDVHVKPEASEELIVARTNDVTSHVSEELYESSGEEAGQDLATGSAKRFNTLELLPMDSSDVEDTEWRRYPVPAELVKCHKTTAPEIRSIIHVSIERLQENFAEEGFKREEAERERRESQRCQDKGKQVERELSDGQEEIGIAVPHLPPVRPAPTPKRKPVNTYSPYAYLLGMEGNWTYGSPLHPRNHRNSSVSTDSGYASGSGENRSRKKETESTRFRGIFKRSKAKALAILEHEPSTSMYSVSLKSQSTSTGSPSVYSEPSENKTSECVSCYEDFDSNETVHLECHDYCKPCFEVLVRTAVKTETYWPAKCCLNEIPSGTILDNIPEPLAKNYNAVSVERAVPAGERIYCSKPSCTAFIPPPSINRDTSTATCASRHCRTKTCTICHGASHPANTECPSDTALIATLALAAEQGWRRCNTCHSMVEHNQGCIHMTCKCKAQFCYICGLKWRTCGCSDAQLVTIRARADAAVMARQLEEAEQRRRARQSEEERQVREREEQARREQMAREAEELAEMLREIEEFEERERIRAEEEAEMERQHAQREREEREKRRLEDISKRYQGLREELDYLHAWQKITIVERYDNAISGLRAENQARLDMEARQADEMQVVKLLKQTKLSDCSFKRDVDIQQHREKELALAKDFERRLVQYYISLPSDQVSNPKQAINQALRSHAEVNEKFRKEWEAAMQCEYEILERSLDREIAVVKVKHDFERRHAGFGEMSRNFNEKTLQFKRIRWSDSMWLEAVAGVRDEMLASYEQAEYAREE